MSVMRAAFAGAGAPLAVCAGDIWRVPDARITFADDNPAVRTRHEGRYVVIAQGDDPDSNAVCPAVLVFPLSSKTEAKRRWEDFLEEHESPLAAPSIVKIHLVQPIPRIALLRDGQYVGAVPDATLDRLYFHLLQNLGIT